MRSDVHNFLRIGTLGKKTTTSSSCGLLRPDLDSDPSPFLRRGADSTSRAVPDARKQLQRGDPLEIALVVVHKHQTPLTDESPLAGALRNFRKLF